MSVGDECVGDDQALRGVDASLPALWDDILSARARVAEHRRPAERADGAPRIALVRALESYLSLIASKGYPPPYALVNELNIQRSIGPGG